MSNQKKSRRDAGELLSAILHLGQELQAPNTGCAADYDTQSMHSQYGPSKLSLPIVYVQIQRLRSNKMYLARKNRAPLHWWYGAPWRRAVLLLVHRHLNFLALFYAIFTQSNIACKVLMERDEKGASLQNILSLPFHAFNDVRHQTEHKTKRTLN